MRRFLREMRMGASCVDASYEPLSLSLNDWKSSHAPICPNEYKYVQFRGGTR